MTEPKAEKPMPTARDYQVVPDTLEQIRLDDLALRVQRLSTLLVSEIGAWEWVEASMTLAKLRHRVDVLDSIVSSYGLDEGHTWVGEER